MKKILFLLIGLILITNAQNYVVKGKLVGFDGKPIKQAVVQLKSGDTNKSLKIESVGMEGEYSIQIPDKGLYKIEFSGINHSSIEIPIVNLKENENINIQLATYIYAQSFDKIKIIGDFNDFEFSKSVDMTKDANGSYFFEIEWNKPEFKYQVMGAEHEGRSINGTMSDSYEYDGGGDWRSIVKTTNGKVKIVFNPNRLIKSDNKMKVDFVNTNSFNNTLYQIQNFEESTNKKLSLAYQNHKESGTEEPFKPDYTELNNYLLNIYDNAKSEEIKNLVRISYLKVSPITTGYKKELVENILDVIPLNSYLWQIDSYSIMQVIFRLPEEQMIHKANELYEIYTDNEKKATLLMQLYSFQLFKKNEAETKRIYELMETKYANTGSGKFFLQRYNKDSKIKVGLEIPNYEIALLDKPDEKVSKQSMLGKIYLIDFWATWCGPCLGEMDHLHKVYEKYKDKGLEILSLSYDSKAEEVTKFREKKWKMPWLHAFVEGGFNNQIGKDFEVVGIPKPILVDKNGKILALEGELRGAGLEKTIGKYLDK